MRNAKTQPGFNLLAERRSWVYKNGEPEVAYALIGNFFYGERT